MKIYLLLELKRDTAYWSESRVIKAFTNKEMAEETMIAKQKVYEQALKEHEQIMKDDYANRLFMERGSTISMPTPQYKHEWSIQEIELITDKFTQFVLKGTTNEHTNSNEPQ